MFDDLPRDTTGTLDWPWSQFEPYYADLIQRPLGPENVPDFLTDWTALNELVYETHSRLHVAITMNTADKTTEERYHRFLDDIYPRAEEAEQKLTIRLLEQSTVPAGLETPLLKMRVDAELFRQENLPLKTQEQKLCNQYDRITSAQTVEWEGKEVTLMQLRPVYQSQDRELRAQAWQLTSERQRQDSDAITDLWRQFMDLRVTMARNAGYGDYRSFRWKEYHRFDYGPEDCKAFHRAIEEVVVPAAARVAEKRRKRLGVASLRPWDMEVDPMGRPPLKPFRSVSELQNGLSSVFHRVDARLGTYFDTMVSEGLLDLDNRKNKAPGGYCTEFAVVKRPFIFMNAVGVHDDVQTLLHESGHAFHAFERSHLPYYQQRDVGMEFSEVASMAMELLASPYLARENGGFYDKSDAARALVEHLEHSIRFWPYMAVVDAFQHWVYEHPDEAKDSSNCDDQWTRLWNRFVTWIDWSGLEKDLMIGWQLKLHIHTVPFYYVEYGLAQLGAVQIWGNALRDQAAAVAAYRAALALGGTVGLRDLFSRAGARFAFDAATLKAAVDLMEQTIASLEEVDADACT